MAIVTSLAFFVTNAVMPVFAAHQIVHFANQVMQSSSAALAPVPAPLAPPDSKSKSRPKQTPTPVPPCSAGTFTFSGNSSTDGSDGNIRTFSSGSVNVHVSAFSVKKNNLNFETSFLGLYPQGLGVTDRGEGNGNNNRHRVDNIGDRVNIVLFEFSQPVIPDKVFLNDVGADGDIAVIIGNANDPYNNHLTLNGFMLTGADIDEGGGSPRVADINPGQRSGNWMVLIPRLLESNDEFKINNLQFTCSAPTPTPTPTPT
ncbi:MAG TPA: hypothetical protein VJT15_18955, partial [Pyrinomonadaceae bacterium]|nr:hypothetical protein [Pyrinomonadaceae bacterium]